ncbi:hypothetical protein Plhal703r1_c08g0045061 [Plasmopara halstedii]
MVVVQDVILCSPPRIIIELEEASLKNATKNRQTVHLQKWKSWCSKLGVGEIRLTESALTT